MTAPQQQKLRISGPMVVTANRVADGIVLYRTNDDSWSAELQAAVIVTQVNNANALLAAAETDELNAVGAYLAPVIVGGQGIKLPGNLREAIRERGPTFALPPARKG
jgi:ABC-type transport system substrate-binding protein